MPNNYIAITASSNRLAANLQNTVDGLAQFLGRLQQLKADMDNMTDGVTFGTVESSFGIPAGKGQAVYNLVAGAVADTNGSANLANLLNWMGAIR